MGEKDQNVSFLHGEGRDGCQDWSEMSSPHWSIGSQTKKSLDWLTKMLLANRLSLVLVQRSITLHSLAVISGYAHIFVRPNAIKDDLRRKIIELAPFSQPVHTLCPPVPKMDEIFFGKPYGSPTPQNTIKIDF